MINEISINSNNAIQLSRGQLLSWVNDMLNANITKIQQLGTGALYCQMLDVLYPGKVQLTKVNFKAKNDYEYINNFKILQQYFTKFGIMKNIEVEKLVKCKYQDNLQFLQWFKKIFDTRYSTGQQQSMKRSTSDHDSHFSLEKENKKPPARALNFSGLQTQKGLNDLLKLQFAKQTGGHRLMHSSTSRSKIDDRVKRQNYFLIKPSTERVNHLQSKPENMESELMQTSKQDILVQQVSRVEQRQPFYSPSKYLERQSFFNVSLQNNGFCNEERQFYLKKFKQIQHLLEIWQKDENCKTLTKEIRKVILMPAEITSWKIDEETGEVICMDEEKEAIGKASQFTETIENNTITTQSQ